MSCNNICYKYKVKGSTKKGVSNFAEGKKRCTKCSILLIWDGVYCPCCNSKLASKPKGSYGWRNMERKRI